MKVELLSKLSDIDKSDWDSLNTFNHPFMSFDFLNSLEVSKSVHPSTGWNPKHIIIKNTNNEIIGVSPLKTKLSAFAISSFYIGIAGSLYFAVYLGALEVTESFDIMAISFPVLFMIIIGGLGSMLGSFLGAAFIVLLPIFLKNVMVDLIGLSAVTAKHFEITTWGLLMVIFLIVEPHGLARLWSIAKEKLRKWPFPY